MEAETKEAPAKARLDWRTLISASDATPAATIEALDKYFEPFAQPVFRDGDKSKEMECIECGEPLNGWLAMIVGSGFTWGITHGEGHCSRCKWPARGHHFIKDADGNDLMTVRNFVLQYHPGFVSKR